MGRLKKLNSQEIVVKTRGFDYQIIIEDQLISKSGKAIDLLFQSKKALLVSDDNVNGYYGEIIEQALSDCGWKVKKVLVKPGENSKSLSEAKRLYEACFEAGLDRNSPVLALGGGVIGDLAGFVAATFMRGVPLIMIPTSLLAQVDSSVGGKVAVNHHLGKNMIGAIYPPRLVLIDPQVLKTLPDRDYQAGLPEMIKYGIIENENFFSFLEENAQFLINPDSIFLSEAICQSIQSKSRVVEKDEFESDYRRILNFGHTIGHALEAATSYRHYLHGEAVLVGMLLAVKLAVKLAYLNPSEAERINRLLGHLKVRKAPAGLTADQVIDKLEHDKKRHYDDLIFILPDQIGSAVTVPVNDRKMLTHLVNSYLEL